MCLIWLISGYCFFIYPPPLDVSTHGHSFVNNGLDKNREWASFISDLYTKLRIISQGSCRLCNWFSLRRLGPWMNHLPLVWWSAFRSLFLKNNSWYVILLLWRGFYLWYLLLSISCLSVPAIFLSFMYLHGYLIFVFIKHVVPACNPHCISLKWTCTT